MNELQIGQKVYYYNCCEEQIPPKSGYYTIDSGEMIDYGGDSYDEYYYVKELSNVDESRLGRQRIWKTHITTLDKLWVCNTCGGTNIEYKAWIKGNSDKIIEDISLIINENDQWCEDCEEHIQIISREEWEEIHNK